jgi:phosphatidate cytidylyltransferase
VDFPPRRPPTRTARPADLEVDFPPLRERPEPSSPRPAEGSAGPPRASGGRGPRSETLARIAWALPWVVFVIAIVAVGGLVFAAAIIGLACLGLEELFRMGRDARPFGLVAFAVAAAMVIAAYYGDQFQIVLVGVAAFPVMFAVAAARDSRDGVTTSLAFTTLGIAWIAVPFAHAVLLRQLPSHGGALLIDVLVGTVFTDTFAYAGGRLFGSHRLAPRLSPNKTLEGLALGFAGGTMAFWFAGLYQDWLSGADALIMGACVAAIAPVGDLFESMVKRDLGVKDTGRIFGPHGGLLDRADAVMFTLVVGYYLAVALVY